MRVGGVLSGMGHPLASSHVLGSTMELLGGRSRGRWALTDRDLGTARYKDELFRPSRTLLGFWQSGVPQTLSARLFVGVPIGGRQECCDDHGWWSVQQALLGRLAQGLVRLCWP